MCTMNSLNYQEALAIVEKFMIDSGIREYCTKICKGDCCGSCCKTNPDSCRHHEEKRLSCSIYLCSKIYNCLPLKKLVLVDNCIMEQYNLFNKLTCCRKNSYFTTQPKVFFEIIRFPISIKTELESIDTKKIKKKIDKLTEEHNKRKTNGN